MQPLPAHTSLGLLTITKVLVEVDEPRLFIARDEAGSLFLAVFSAGDYDRETWVYAPISPQQAREVQDGYLDYHTAFKSPLGGKVWEVSYVAAGAQATAVQLPVESISETWLPKPGRKAATPVHVVDQDIEPGAHALPRIVGKRPEAA